MEPATTDAASNLDQRSQTIADIVGAGDGGRRNFSLMVKTIGALAVLSALVAVAIPFLPRSERFRADRIWSLPADAKIVAISDPLGGGYGEITFTVPEPKGPGTRLSELWGRTPYGLPATFASSMVRGRITPAHSKAWSPLPGRPGAKVAAPAKKSTTSGTTVSKGPAAKSPFAKGAAVKAGAVGTGIRGPRATRPVGPYAGYYYGSRAIENGYVFQGFDDEIRLTYQRKTGRYIYRHSPRRNPYEQD